MQIKDGAVIAGLDIRIRPALVVCDDLLGEKFVITCGLDGTHSAGSLHYYGLAIDIRTRFLTKSEVYTLVNELTKALGIAFNVVMHSLHIHIEYDAR